MVVETRTVSASPNLSGEQNAVQAIITPRACWRMDDIQFDFGLSFVRAGAGEEFGRLHLLLQDHPGSKLSLFGHADPVGDDNGNKTLSGRRAMAVYAVLTRRTDLWERLYSQPAGGDRWGQSQFDEMSASIGGPAGQRYASPGERSSLFQRYMDAVCRTLAEKPYTLDPATQFLGEQADPDGRGDYQGCGEFNPVLMFSATEARAFAVDSDKATRNAANAPNRRVVGLLFEKRVAIDVARWPCPAALDGPTRCRERFFADHRIRRQFQTVRRVATEQGDTFACRFFDRISAGSPCNTATPPVRRPIRARREAIPLVFVPGIMGTRLRRPGTNGTGTGPDGLPNLRWDPSDISWMLGNVSGTSGDERKGMLVGRRFDPAYLEVDNSNPVGDGFHGIMADYCEFLNPLRITDWGVLGELFTFPVYAVGYNWTDSNDNSGRMLADRLKEIIREARCDSGSCENVIVITHSMGGIVARSASELHGAAGSILGIIHGVQPATGAPAAYWRIKAGFEAPRFTQGPLSWAKGVAASWTLGNSGRQVTPVLGNIPGGLQLLPNKHHRTNEGNAEWLTITEDGRPVRALPRNDPYEELYRVKAVVRPGRGEKPSNNDYWGLVDPDLLDPGNAAASGGNARDVLDASSLSSDPWPQYLQMLALAEAFHDRLGVRAHRHTLSLAGTGHETADVVEMQVQSNWVWSDPYRTRGFRGLFTDATGKPMQAVLQDPAGDGDGTVPRSSAQALNAAEQPAGDAALPVEHQSAYQDKGVEPWVIDAILALCKGRYYEKGGAGIGDYPAPMTGTRYG